MPTRLQTTPVPVNAPSSAAHLRSGAPGGVVPGGSSRVAVVLALVPLMEAFDVSWPELLREAGLRPDQFDDPEQLIPFGQGSRFLGLCADRSGCAHLGVLTGRHTPIEALGIVADLARAAPDVRTALALVSRYLTLSDGGGLATLVEDARFASYGYALYEPGIDRAEIIYDHVLGVIWNVLRALCGANWLPHEVLLSRRRPTETRPYRKFFRAPLHFDAEQSAVVFDKTWLDQPIATADPVRLNALVAQARDLEAQGAGDLPAQVRRVLRRQLLSGNSSMARVAAELGMHRRTLDRQLQPHAVGYRELNDEVRQEVARQLLSDTTMSITAIAQSLHYNDASAFTHAFRRWSGMSPSRWRGLAAARTPAQRER